MSRDAPDKTRDASPGARKRAVDADTGAAIGSTITATDGLDLAAAAAPAPERTPELDDTALADPSVATGDPATGAGARIRASATAADPLIGQSVDRYRIVARLGAGGMGVVYQAYDPALDRKVALKLLPPRDEGMAQLETRLRREAQALARLDHPNVVAVYDVGVAVHSVFVAMQLVEGTTLAEHLVANKPTPAQILALFVAAGRGLAAAHVAGIVHRDVKPANVLVDGTGRVRVGDFGLARSQGDDEQDDPDPALSPTSLLHAELTRAGAVMGTPLYMSPEQHHGEPATARSDQFSFCVCLWEALLGQHPYHTGRWDAGAVVAAMDGDRLREPPRVRGVPARVITALRRGLRGDPAARWPDMDALLATLEPRRVPAWSWIGVAAAVVAGAVVVTSIATRTTRDPAATCRAAVARMRTIWPARKQLLRGVLATSNLPDRDAMADNVGRGLDDYTRRWTTMRLQMCDAPSEREREQTPALRDMQERCLDLDREVVFDVVERVLTGDRAAVAQAAKMVMSLPILDECASKAQMAMAPPPVEHIVEISEIRRRLQQLDAIVDNQDTSIAELRTMVPRAEAIGYPPLTAQVYGALASTLHAGQQPDPALEMRAAEVATTAHSDRVAALAYLLAVNDALDQPDLPRIDTLLPVARAAAMRAGDLDIMTRLAGLTAGIEMAHGRADNAASICAAAIDDAPASDRETIYQCLVSASLKKGDIEGADRWSAAELDFCAKYYGIQSDTYVEALRHQAMIRREQGRFDDASRAIHEALDRIEAVYGTDDVRSAELLIDLSQYAVEAGAVDQAIPLAQRALAVAQKSKYGSTVFFARMTLAQVLKQARRRDEMYEQYRAALVLGEQILSPDDSNLARLRLSLGSALAEDQRYDEASSLLAQGEAAFEHTHSPYAVSAMIIRGEILQETGKWGDSIPLLERAVQELEASKIDARNLYATKLNLAISLHQVGEDTRARALVEETKAKLGDQASVKPLLDEANDILDAITHHRNVKL